MKILNNITIRHINQANRVNVNNQNKIKNTELKQFDKSTAQLNANYNIAFLGLTNSDEINSKIRTKDITLEAQKEYPIENNAVFVLAQFGVQPVILDLASCEIKPLIDNLNPGESIVFGRETGQPKETSPDVSKKHLIVSKNADGSLVAIDNNSTNCTKLLKNVQASEFNVSGFEFKKGNHYEIPLNTKLILGESEFDISEHLDLIRKLSNHQKLTVGSRDDSDIVIPNETVEAKHIELERCGKKLVLTNLVDETKTKFNGLNLDKYKPNPNVDTLVSHTRWCMKNVNMYKDRYGMPVHNCSSWAQFLSKNTECIPWKMHIFSADSADWRKMCTMIAPYLKDNNINWKTFGILAAPEELTDNQRGKAFTIYPRSIEEMEQVAKDIDYIIRANNMTIDNSDISGDRKMGSTGRLFYRYELKSGKYKDRVFDTNSYEDYKCYDKAYRPANGNYLADDMTEDDDIWLNFNPIDKKAKAAV